MFKNKMYFCSGKAEFPSIITSVRNHFCMLKTHKVLKKTFNAIIIGVSCLDT